MLKVLDLFSGIGGFSLGLERTGGFETVAFCEIEDFPRRVLAKHWPDVPIYDDVRTLDHAGPVDIITGGYPCQPFSLNGVRGGGQDNRHLWPAMFRVIEKHRPRWVIGENVFGHISLGIDQVLFDLETGGYTVRPFVIPACAVDARHRCDRVWIVAHTARVHVGRDKPRPERQRTRPGGQQVPGINGANRSMPTEIIKSRLDRVVNGIPRWLDEPLDIPRVAVGINDRVARLKALGNAVVPQVVERIGAGILAAEREAECQG